MVSLSTSQNKINGGLQSLFSYSAYQILSCIMHAWYLQEILLNTCVLRNVSYRKTCSNTLLNIIYASISFDKKVSGSLSPCRLFYALTWKPAEGSPREGKKEQRGGWFRWGGWGWRQESCSTGISPRIKLSLGLFTLCLQGPIFPHRDAKWGFFLVCYHFFKPSRVTFTYLAHLKQEELTLSALQAGIFAFQVQNPT